MGHQKADKQKNSQNRDVGSGFSSNEDSLYSSRNYANHDRGESSANGQYQGGGQEEGRGPKPSKEGVKDSSKSNVNSKANLKR